MQTKTIAKICKNRVQVCSEDGDGLGVQIWGHVQKIDALGRWYMVIDGLHGESHIAGIWVDAIQKGDD